jgi:hypothetical protein
MCSSVKERCPGTAVRSMSRRVEETRSATGASRPGVDTTIRLRRSRSRTSALGPATAKLTENGGTASCSGPPFACTCIVSDVPIETTTSLTGTLRHGGATLDPIGSEQPMPFCVEDGVLRLWTLSGSGSSMADECSSDADCATDDQSVGVCVPTP